MVCLPSLMLLALTVTPGASSMLEDVVPDVLVLSVAVEPVPVDVDPLTDGELVPAVDVAADALSVVPSFMVPVLVVPVVDDPEPVPSDDVLVESAFAPPPPGAPHTPLPTAAAPAPNRPR